MFNEIKDILFEYHPHSIGSFNNSPILDVELLLDAYKPYHKNILYVANEWDELLDYELIGNMTILICSPLLLDNSKYAEVSNKLNLNIIYTLKNEGYKKIYKRLKEHFFKQKQLSYFSKCLLETLYRNGGIQELVEVAYGFLENPVTVFDGGFNLIAANKEIKKTEDNSQQHLLKERMPDFKDIKNINTEKIHEKVKNSSTPILINNKKLGNERIVSMIDTKKDIGHIVVVADYRPFKDIDYDYITIFRDALNQQQSKEVFNFNAKGFNYEYFLKDLLDEKIAVGKQFYERMSYADRKFDAPIYCLVIEVGRSLGAIVVNTIREKVETLFEGISTINYNEQIVIIITRNNHKYLNNKQIQQIRNFCLENQLFCGMSNSFDSIIELSEYYKQALRAIELGICDNNKPNLFIYEKYFLSHIADIVSKKENLLTFCYPKLNHLMNYDKKYKKEYAYTLYMFLLYERNISATSSVMNIHRNTLTYRLDKIKTIADFDLEDANIRQYIIISYEMVVKNSVNN